MIDVKVANGRMASIALDYFAREIKDNQTRLLSLLMTDQRSGVIDEKKLIGFAASYTALEDLLQGLLKKELVARKKDEELLK